MHVHSLRIKNFRRLKDVRVELASDISIFVGSNNSGKTSASQAVQLFTSAAKERFSIHDYNTDCWREIDDFGEGRQGATLPLMSMDVWLHVDVADLHRVIDLLPGLTWQGTLVGLRIEFAPTDEAHMLQNFRAAHTKACENVRPGVNGGADYHPFPKYLTDYLSSELRREFSLRYYVLDHAQFDDDFVERDGYQPLQLMTDRGRSGKDILDSLIKVDFLHAQRHLSDFAVGSRAEDLSRVLSRFYERNLEKRGDDFEAMRALADSELLLNDHLSRVFAPTLARLSELGYPGLTNPRLLIKSALNPTTILSSSDGARVHYAMGALQEGVAEQTLPDRYNGLGFKNLIYMVVELLGIHAQWLDIEEKRPPLHLIFIEEPETHLHAQLQQVFIRKVIELLQITGDDEAHYKSQLVVTTHSPHILYERGFLPIRYFRRGGTVTSQTTDVLNLSAFYHKTQNPARDFLERYLKLTHCDLFFADAAVLVEGNVERLLLPQMIKMASPRLQSSYLSILEIGGAFGHRFKSLIEYLGITALIITDIDSVHPALEAGLENAEGQDDVEDDAGAGSSCMVHVEGAVTCNQTLIQWLPARRTIAELLAATDEHRTQPRGVESPSAIRVAYQSPVAVTWREETKQFTGRTLEVAFAFQNLAWCQHADRADLNLRYLRSDHMTLDQLTERLHSRIKGSKFNKTDFALALLSHDPAGWQVPDYIARGLRWLEDEIAPLPLAVEAPAAAAAPAAEAPQANA